MGGAYEGFNVLLQTAIPSAARVQHNIPPPKCLL